MRQHAVDRRFTQPGQLGLGRGSLLIVVLYHAAQNAWANLLDTTPPPGPNDLRPFILATVLMWAVALTLIAVYGPQRLSRKPASEMPQI